MTQALLPVSFLPPAYVGGVTISFTPLAGTGPEIGSPGRALGALLAGAYRSGDRRALTAVEQLSATGQPVVVVPHTRGAFSWDNYSAGQVMSDYGTAAIASDQEFQQGLPSAHIAGTGQVGNRESSFAATHVAGDFEFRLSLEDSAGLDLEGLRIAAAHVSHFGRGHDLSLCQVHSGDRDVSREASVWVPTDRRLPADRGTAGWHRRWRVWSPELVEWYDDQHTAVMGFVDADGVEQEATAAGQRVDARVRTGSWIRLGRKAAAIAGDSPRVVIATNRPYAQRRLPELLSSISGENPLPMIDRRGFVRGISVVLAPGASLTASWASSDAAVLRCQQPESWLRTDTGRIWTSATPVALHPDERIARWQVEREFGQGSVLRIATEPWHQSTAPIPIPASHRRWWIDVRTDAVGPLQIGDLTELGFGLLRPLAQKGTKR